jgi:hypothetical protein
LLSFCLFDGISCLFSVNAWDVLFSVSPQCGWLAVHLYLFYLILGVYFYLLIIHTICIKFLPISLTLIKYPLLNFFGDIYVSVPLCCVLSNFFNFHFTLQIISFWGGFNFIFYCLSLAFHFSTYIFQLCHFFLFLCFLLHFFLFVA